MTAKRLIYPLIAAIALTSCGDTREVQEQLTAARDMGHRRALELAADVVGTDTVMMTNTLIDVRERETRLRTRGHDKVADAYIISFLATLDSVNPSLAAAIR